MTDLFLRGSPSTPTPDRTETTLDTPVSSCPLIHLGLQNSLNTEKEECSLRVHIFILNLVLKSGVKNFYVKPGIVALEFSPSTREAEPCRRISELEVSLVYRVSSRTVRAT